MLIFCLVSHKTNLWLAVNSEVTPHCQSSDFLLYYFSFLHLKNSWPSVISLLFTSPLYTCRSSYVYRSVVWGTEDTILSTMWVVGIELRLSSLSTAPLQAEPSCQPDFLHFFVPLYSEKLLSTQGTTPLIVYWVYWCIVRKCMYECMHIYIYAMKFLSI